MAPTASSPRRHSEPNPSRCPSVFAAKIDTKAPAKPSGLALTSASDTGISATDHLTNDTTPTFSGNAEANALITIRDGATAVGTGIANAAGHWTVTVSRARRWRPHP